MDLALGVLTVVAAVVAAAAVATLVWSFVISLFEE